MGAGLNRTRAGVDDEVILPALGLAEIKLINSREPGSRVGVEVLGKMRKEFRNGGVSHGGSVTSRSANSQASRRGELTQGFAAGDNSILWMPLNDHIILAQQRKTSVPNCRNVSARGAEYR
jgi:hypothetical protein